MGELGVPTDAVSRRTPPKKRKLQLQAYSVEHPWLLEVEFSKEAVSQLDTEFSALDEDYEKLLVTFGSFQFQNQKALEFAHHGFGRRLSILRRAIQNVFSIFPPGRTKLLTNKETSDVTINLQAFVFNVFGCTDNLAWIWVHERGLTLEDGRPVPSTQVGLRKKQLLVRSSFSDEMREYLAKLDDWFGMLEDYRHSLAHRIPLYVPPYVVPRSKIADFEKIEAQITAVRRGVAVDNYNSLIEQQRELGRIPISMVHSIEEAQGPIIFHAQLIADFRTIEELAYKFLEECEAVADIKTTTVAT